MTDPELMQSIKENYGAAIAAAANNCTVPAAFFAALTANESGGNPNAKRFEASVLASLWQVLLGRKTAYGSIKTSDLVRYLTGVEDLTFASALPRDALNRFDALATSWGLTQILGYNTFPIAMTIEELQTPDGNLACATHMLAAFCVDFRLDPTKDFEPMFRCWNGGHPTAQTFDPEYVPNGLKRMAIWNAL